MPDIANLGLVRPPLVYLTSLVSGVVIHLATPLRFLPETLAVPLRVPLIAVAIALFSYSVAKFRAAGTPRTRPKAHHCDRPHGPVSLQPEPDLSGVLRVPVRYRDLGQQRMAAGYTRRGSGADPLCCHTERRAVPGREIRCAVLGL